MSRYLDRHGSGPGRNRPLRSFKEYVTLALFVARYPPTLVNELFALMFSSFIMASFFDRLLVCSEDVAGMVLESPDAPGEPLRRREQTHHETA